MFLVRTWFAQHNELHTTGKWLCKPERVLVVVWGFAGPTLASMQPDSRPLDVGCGAQQVVISHQSCRLQASILL